MSEVAVDGYSHLVGKPIMIDLGNGTGNPDWKSYPSCIMSLLGLTGRWNYQIIHATAYLYCVDDREPNESFSQFVNRSNVITGFQWSNSPRHVLRLANNAMAVKDNMIRLLQGVYEGVLRDLRIAVSDIAPEMKGRL